MNVLLYVFDSLRPDHLQSYGYDRETSPAIDAIADDGVRFTNAFAQGIWTAPTSGSIFTGLYPSVHGGETVSQPLSPAAPRLAKALKRAGLTTGCISTIDQVSGFRGYDDGFDEFVELFETYDPDDPELGVALHDRMDEWLAARAPEEDWFLCAWSLGTHTPYVFSDDTDPMFTDESYDGPVDGSISSLKSAGSDETARILDLYDSAIRQNDARLGRIVDRLKREGMYDDTLIIVTGDHGEVFDEHARLEQTSRLVQRAFDAPGSRRLKEQFGLFESSGFIGHSALLPYDELIRVPLVVKYPDQRHSGTVEDRLVESIDIFPTAVDTVTDADGSVEGLDVHGESLHPAASSEEPNRSYVFSESITLKGSNRYLSARDRSHKYVRIQLSLPTLGDIKLQPHRALYSLLEYAVNDTRLVFHVDDLDGSADHDERTNRFGDDTDRDAKLMGALEDWAAFCEQFDLESSRSVVLDADTQDRLERLGYLGE